MRLGSTGRAGAGLVLASLISWSAASPTYGYKDICPLPCLGSPGLNSRGDDTKWTDLDFKAPAIADNEHMPAPERWSSLKCNDAWSDFVDHWKDQRDKYKDRDDGDKPEFSTSLVNFFDIKDSAHCGLPSGDNYCSEIASCADWSDTDKTGPAGLQIWNSFVFLHNVSLLGPQ